MHATTEDVKPSGPTAGNVNSPTPDQADAETRVEGANLSPGDRQTVMTPPFYAVGSPRLVGNYCSWLTPAGRRIGRVVRVDRQGTYSDVCPLDWEEEEPIFYPIPWLALQGEERPDDEPRDAYGRRLYVGSHIYIRDSENPGGIVLAATREVVIYEVTVSEIGATGFPRHADTDDVVLQHRMALADPDTLIGVANRPESEVGDE